MIIFSSLVLQNSSHLQHKGDKHNYVCDFRIKLLPKEGHQHSNFHSRRSIIPYHFRKNDYDHHSSRFGQLRPQMHIVYDTPPNTEAKAGKVYQPREDPRFFYQSDSYMEEVNRKNLNNEVSATYLERGVVRANEHKLRSLPFQLRDNEINSIYEGIIYIYIYPFEIKR